MIKSNKVFYITTIIDALIIITFMPIRACVGRTARPGFLRLLPPKYRPGPDCFKVLMAAVTMMVMMVVETIVMILLMTFGGTLLNSKNA